MTIFGRVLVFSLSMPMMAAAAEPELKLFTVEAEVATDCAKNVAPEWWAKTESGNRPNGDFWDAWGEVSGRQGCLIKTGQALTLKLGSSKFTEPWFPKFNHLIVRAALKGGSEGGTLLVQVDAQSASVDFDSHFMWAGPKRSWDNGDSYHCGPAPGTQDKPNFQSCFQGFDEIVVPLGQDISFDVHQPVQLKWTAKDGRESVALDLVDFLFDEEQAAPEDALTIKASDADWIEKVEAGGVFFLEKGEYTLNKQIVVKENTVIQGSSMMGTKIKLQLPVGGKAGYGCMQNYGSRSGFISQSNTKISFLSVYGFDNFAWHDNGNLCGGGAFETPGCADPALTAPETACPGNIQTPGATPGKAITNVSIQDVFTTHTVDGVWIPRQGSAPIGSDVHVSRLVVRKSWRDGVNIHGATQSSVTFSDVRDTGDDNIAIWSLQDVADNMVFDNNRLTLANVAHNIAWYGGKRATITNNYCADALGGGARMMAGFWGTWDSESHIKWSNNGPFARLNKCSDEHCPICDQYGAPQWVPDLLEGAPKEMITAMSAICKSSPQPPAPTPAPSPAKPCAAGTAPKETDTNMNSWFPDRDATAADCAFRCTNYAPDRGWCRHSEFSTSDNGTCKLWDCVPQGSVIV